MKPFKLINQVQNYSWGTKNYIPDLLGKDETNEHWAELWMGDHARGTSTAVLEIGNIPLNQVLMNFSTDIFGEDSIRFGKQLPFLFKVLSAESPLSIQAHPNKVQAEEGFRDENSRSIPMDAVNRNYKDNNHKPEIICALTPFTAMCGFREVEEINTNFLKLHTSVYTAKNSVKSFFESIMSLKSAELKIIIEDALVWAESNNSIEAELVQKFSALYDNDPGILAPLFLNVYSLKPGEALYQGPGELHAYVKGTGIELMSNSDNVLRGGLTPKHVDIEELLKVLNFKPSGKNILKPVTIGRGLYEYLTPSDEFILKYLKIENSNSLEIKNRESLEILLCVSGNVIVSYENETISINRGESLFIPASVNSYTLKGSGEIYSAGIPRVNK
ncbi:MAG: mannose-6-phosphate isomerase, class I [Spirochaetota bacterium]|nr:mannose-6-phosphate isomerase, class I [Spirochaetota bacterium]